MREYLCLHCWRDRVKDPLPSLTISGLCDSCSRWYRNLYPHVLSVNSANVLDRVISEQKALKNKPSSQQKDVPGTSPTSKESEA